MNTVPSHDHPEQIGPYRILQVSVSQLTRKLSALIDQTPGQLIRGMRLERAAAMVAGNTGNLSEIAYRVGFSDQAHFSRSFKRHFGMTPSEYREARPGLAQALE